jgi:CRISPR-associated Csx2 family protein
MDGYTLISFIGKGMIRTKEGKEDEYLYTRYKFPNDEKKYVNWFFIDAILGAKNLQIKKVILVGTSTSSWKSFLVKPYLSNERSSDASSVEAISNFMKKLDEECKTNGISEASIAELESKLPGWYYGVPFNIVVHSDKIDQDSVVDIFSAYEKIPDLLEPETDILFDITHSFRSMPILVFQSLQLNASKIFGRRVELIYGELSKDTEISYVRDLSKYWDYYEITLAINLFDEKLDGKLLAKKIKKEWKKGAEFLIWLTEIIECNYSLQIPNALVQLKEALDDYSEAGKPQWVTDVYNRLAKIYSDLYIDKNEKYPVAKTIWKYAELLNSKNLITQTIIALQVVVETAITEYLDPDPKRIGNYNWFKSHGDKKLKTYYKDKSIYWHQPLLWLFNTRNEIAHGGRGIMKKSPLRQAELKERIKPYNNAIRQLFIALG